MERQSEIPLDVQWLGRRRYADIWDLQKQLLAQRIENAIGDTLLLVEHEPVYTWGKRTAPEHLGAGVEALGKLGADTFEVERGGEVTYHGPGQLVGYPICNLGNLGCGKDLHIYMRGLEEMVIQMLDGYGISGERVEGLTGVWARASSGSGIQDSEPAKVAALGVRVRKWCTMHGFAINLTDEVLPWFKHVVPCGIGDRPVTTLQKLTGKDLAMSEVLDRVVEAFQKVLMASSEPPM